MTGLQLAAANGTITKNYTDAGSYHYEDANANNPVLDNISHESGRYKKLAAVWVKEYFLSDHLGNTRVTFKISPSLDLIESKHYYAFGLTIEGLSNLAGPDDDNRFTYNGKEIDKDLNWYHYGARFYDPQIGRWHVTDPADEFGSPYIYVANDPNGATDPDGMITDYFVDSYGKEIGNIPSKNPDRFFAENKNGTISFGGKNWSQLFHQFTLGIHKGSDNDLLFTNGNIIQITMSDIEFAVDWQLNRYSILNPLNSFPGGGLDFKTAQWTPFSDKNALYQLGDKLFNGNEISNVYWGYAISKASYGIVPANFIANFGSLLIGTKNADYFKDGYFSIFNQSNFFDSPNDNEAVKLGQGLQREGY